MKNTTPSIVERAITYQMSVASFNPTKKVKDVQQKAAKEYGCDEKVFTGTVHLLDDTYTKALVEKVRAIRTFFETNTLKLGLVYIIPSNNYWRVADFVRNDIPKFDSLRDDFLNRWEGEIRPNSFRRLQKLGYVDQVANAKIWKYSKSDVESRIYFDFAKGTLSSPATLDNMKGLTEDLRQSFAGDIRSELEALEIKAHREIASRMVKVLSDFVHKFKTMGERSRVHESITSNIADLADLVPSLVVKDDPKLLELAAEAKKLASWDIDVLKDDEASRKEAVVTAESILSKMSL